MVTAPYTCAVFRNGADVPSQERGPILGSCDEIMDELWHKDTFLMRKQEQRLFADDHGFIVVSAADRIVGFLLYRRLDVRSAKVLYVSATHVRRLHQGRGLNRLMSERMLDIEYREWAKGPFYVAWRTRNPVVWASIRNWCSLVVPDMLTGKNDPELVELCKLSAEILFPHVALEVPSMIMRGAYPQLSLREPQHHRDRTLDALFFENGNLARIEDAVFSLGAALRPKTPSLQ